MKLLCCINDRLTWIHPVDISVWETLKPSGLEGIPAFSYLGKEGELYLWPKPIPEVQVYAIAEQSFVK